MQNRKMPKDFEYVKEMYDDNYYPDFLVDKVKDAIQAAVVFIEEGSRSSEEIQSAFDEMVLKINALQEEFEENNSCLETVARDSIGVTVENIIQYFAVDIDVEEAIRNSEW
jgi:methyl-accepting chemotaxis protein